MENMFIDNQEFESEEPKQEEKVVNFDNKQPECPQVPFAFWTVGTNTFKLKLSVSEQIELESKFKRNLISLMGDTDNLPPVTTMLQVVHSAMKPYHHGVKLKNVQELYEQYVENGGSMMKFYAEVYLRVFMVSGFFTSTISTDLSENLDKITQDMD